MTQALEQRIIETTNALLEEWCLAEDGWTVAFGSAKKRLGSCDYGKRVLRFSRVFIAQATWQEIEDVILHEVAHAMVGPHQGHGELWKNTAEMIGLDNPARTMKVDMVYDKPWVGTCKNGHTTKSQSRAPLVVRSCGKCSPGKFDLEFVWDWKKNGQKVPMPARFQREYNDAVMESILNSDSELLSL